MESNTAILPIKENFTTVIHDVKMQLSEKRACLILLCVCIRLGVSVIPP